MTTALRGYLYVPTEGEPTLLVGRDLTTVATVLTWTPGPETPRAYLDATGKAAKGATPGLYKARVTLPKGLRKLPRVTRGARCRSVLDEVRALDAAARARPEGRRVTPREVAGSHMARALAAALRSHVLHNPGAVPAGAPLSAPVHCPTCAAERGVAIPAQCPHRGTP